MTQNQNLIIEKKSLQKLLQISDSIKGNLSDLDLNSEFNDKIPESLVNVKNRIFSLYSQFHSLFNPIKDGTHRNICFLTNCC